MSKETIVSGVRSTGNLHLGNYFGAVKNFVRMQETENCFFFVADYHALTTHPTPENLAASEKQVIIEYLACGLDPEKCTLYLQSDIPQTAELYLFLNMLAYKGELERVTTFKDKARQQPDNVNAGLLTYPTLMAADILIHKGTKVPVGKDQEQHLEMTRTFGNRFNQLYKTDYFPEPVAYNFGTALVKVPGLDGSGKMGKSEGEGNALFLNDDDATIRKKIMRAVTDGGPTVENQEKPEAIKNIFQLMRLVSTDDTVAHFENTYNTMTIRYGDMKKQLAEDMVAFVNPISAKIKDLTANTDYIKNVIAMGKEKASASADVTIKDVRSIIGFK